jgi:nucleotide-binding universal stress UspA family protein
MDPRAVVVGTAGAGSGTIAVEWAADEAQRRRRPLRIVHILEWHPDEGPASAGNSYVERVWASASAMTYAACHQVRSRAPGLPVKADILIGHPATWLLELAPGADLIVLGHRGGGGFAGLRLGSVSQRVALHAPCPVAVIRDRPHPGGPVVAGADDSPAADHVLDTAFAAAATRAARLVVVRASGPVIPLLPAHARPAEVNVAEQDGAELERLRERLAPWRRKFPQIRADVEVTRDSVAPALIEASTRAQLVIVGSRGRGAVRGALLGSTGRQLLRHAECPVLVTRPRG